MNDQFKPAIEALEIEIRQLEGKLAETKRMINRLHELGGGSPVYADTVVQERGSLAIRRADQFYGKVLMTAMREYFEMRHNSNLGPATPRDIHQALTDGGFKFDTKIEINALTHIRATLRKNSGVFHRLPNGQYGLLAWYPNAKSPKIDPTGDDDVQAPVFVPKKRKLIFQKSSHHSTSHASATTKAPIAPFILETMMNGATWNTEDLKKAALSKGLEGIDADTTKNVFHGALMGLRKRKLVEQMPTGGWRLSTTLSGPSLQKGAA